MLSHLLLFSTSRLKGQEFLEFAREPLLNFLQGETTIYFAPFASGNHEQYTERIQQVFAPWGLKIIGLHTFDRPADVIAQEASVLFVGGGNSFRLVRSLHELGLIPVIRAKVATGYLRYIGSSAGTNMACPTMRTTNDMPIVQPISFDSLGLLPFQINPHYLDADPNSTHMGETRETRITEFLEENDVPVLGLREGAWLERHDGLLTLGGKTGARLFTRGQESVEYEEGADLSTLLAYPARYDISMY